MKKILITCLFCSGFLWGNAQIIVDKKDINKDTTINTIMVSIQKTLGEISNDFMVTIDIGQEQKYRKVRIRNAHNDVIRFESPINVLVFFEENGWILQHFSTSINNTHENLYYIFRRKK